MDKTKNAFAINLADYHYDLPESRIARYPVSPRDSSKLLLYEQGDIRHDTFKNIPQHLGKQHILFFNNTKVLPARIYFRKETGALIEVFLLHPVQPTNLVQEAMLVKDQAIWACTVGNFKKWKSEMALKRSLSVGKEDTWLSAQIHNRESGLIKFSWDNPSLNFVDVIQAAGVTPLPPYLNRKATEEDKETYQTVYSKKEGAVAAPTAGLHFTPEVLKSLSDNGVKMDELTLHVSAGTFRPIKAKNIPDHDMHKEQVIVNRKNIRNLTLANKSIIAVGTTSMRTLESVYWYGVKLLLKDRNAAFFVEKLLPYEYGAEQLPSKEEAARAVLDYMERHKLDELTGETEIFLFPGYKFQVCDGLITNYHMPKSTLILLIAAFIGDDWKRIYKTALEQGYRFLSYGDSSLLFRKP